MDLFLTRLRRPSASGACRLNLFLFWPEHPSQSKPPKYPIPLTSHAPPSVPTRYLSTLPFDDFSTPSPPMTAAQAEWVISGFIPEIPENALTAAIPGREKHPRLGLRSEQAPPTDSRACHQPFPSIPSPQNSPPMQNTSISWLTAEDRAQYAKVLGAFHTRKSTPLTMSGTDANAHDLDFACGTFAEQKPPRGHGARFDCPHCGTALRVANLPASGPCPSCDGPLDLTITTSKLWGRVAAWLPWLLALLMILIIVWGVLLIGKRLGFAALDVDSYDPVRDNRFAAWPWSLQANPTCRVPAEAITGIGWDSRGSSLALVDPSFVVITHNTPPEKLTFRDGKGRIYRRLVVSSHTLSRDVAGLPWIRLCRLDAPLPPTVRPLPILELSGHRKTDLPLFMVGRHSRIGSERPAGLPHARPLSPIAFRPIRR